MYGRSLPGLSTGRLRRQRKSLHCIVEAVPPLFDESVDGKVDVKFEGLVLVKNILCLMLGIGGEKMPDVLYNEAGAT